VRVEDELWVNGRLLGIGDGERGQCVSGCIREVWVVLIRANYDDGFKLGKVLGLFVSTGC
jgi:hypothetical protein